MKKNESIMRHNKPLRLILGLIFLITPLLLGAQSLWEGSAAVGAYGVLPVRGFYGASNSFPRNTLVEIENLENGNSVEIIIVDRLESSSFLVLLSQEAGTSLDIGDSGVIRVRATLGQADKSDTYSLNNDQVHSRDPDTNPSVGAEESLSEISDTDEILALSYFPVDEPVAPLEGEVAVAEPVEPEAPELEAVEPEKTVIDEEPIAIEEPEVVVEEPEVVVEEPEVVIEEPIAIEEPEVVVEAEGKRPEPADVKKDPVIDVAHESIGAVIEGDETEDIVVETPPEPAVEIVTAEPDLEPVESGTPDVPVITYISEDLVNPDERRGEPLSGDLSSPSLNLESAGMDEGTENIRISSYPFPEPGNEISGALFTVTLPEPPEIIRASELSGEEVDIPVINTLVMYEPEADDEIDLTPILPALPDKQMAADIVVAEGVSLVDSGYIQPELQDVRMEITHSPEYRVQTAFEADEIPVPFNGYKLPVIGPELEFAQAVLPGSPVETEVFSDETPILTSGFAKPRSIDNIEFAQAALPSEPSDGTEVTVEVPRLINGFMNPRLLDNVDFAQAALPDEPDYGIAVSLEIPTPINGFMTPGDSGSIEFARAVLPSEPEEAETPEALPGFMTPEDVDSAEFAAAVSPEEPETADDETPVAINGWVDPGDEEILEVAMTDEPLVPEEAAEETPEKIEIEAPVFEEDVELVLTPAGERPPEILDVPVVVEGIDEAPELAEATIDDGDTAEPEIGIAVETVDGDPGPVVGELPTLTEILESEGTGEKVTEAAPEAVIPEVVTAAAPIVSNLEQGFHYIQVGVYGDQAGASTAVNGLKNWSPVPVVVWTPESADSWYKVMVGPLTPDESGVMLFHLKGKGYNDAFLRKVVELN